MPLTDQQKKLIVSVDSKVKSIFKRGGNEETLLVEMFDLMPKIKSLLNSDNKKEIELYFYEYDGFYRYMKVLENLAQRIADGKITIPR